jgi:hypothetical protein
LRYSLSTHRLEQEVCQLSDRWAEFGQMGKTPACTREEHGSCAHFAAQGGGINPRRLRLEAGAGLCACSCHSSCPVAVSDKRMTVPLKTWHESCTCPGAEEARRRLEQDGADLRGFGEMWEDRRRLTRARREASEAARARAAGKTRDETREIYLAELNARDLPEPSGAVLDAIVDSIGGNPLPAVRLATESLVQTGKAIGRLSRLFRSGS